LTRDPDSFIHLIAKLCNEQLSIAYPNPVLEWYKHSHPSPGKRIAFADKNLKLWLLELESKKVAMVDSSSLWEIYYYSFSPCSKWLAFSKPVQRDRQFYSVFLHDIEKGQTHRITDVMTNDYEPVFGPDGKYLHFISGRDLKPKLGRFEMSYLYENTDRVYLLTLQADTLSPLAPRSDEEEPEKKDSEQDEKNEKEKKEDKKPPAKTGDSYHGQYSVFHWERHDRHPPTHGEEQW